MNTEKEFFYLDRPAVPAFQQTIIEPQSLTEHSVLIGHNDLGSGAIYHATEVHDSEGLIIGTVLYASGLSLADLMEPVSDDIEYREDMEDEEAVLQSVSDEVDPADLELELAAAKQHVRDLEDEISEIEKSEGC